MDIKILPSNISNVIAAGEVVLRPSSVVKELMENSVDASAGQIDVIIQDAGRTMIRIIDNGCGMSPDDAVICFERHATSKLSTVDDLMNISTFGFRGEALASIAAVSEVTLRTRQAANELGCEVLVADSRQLSAEEVVTPVGTNICVRNLFYNVPARRKHLKSDNVEFKHIVTEFTRVALTRPDIGFKLSHNGKDIFVLAPAKSLKFRIQDLLGSGAVNEIVDMHAETSVVRLSGYVGRPDLAKKTLGNQFFFVNGRFFKSPYMHKAVMKAYENLVPDGAVPSYFIYFEVDPHTIDVNVSPTKTEIKFEEDNVIFQILFAAVKEALGKNSFGASIDFDREGVPDIPVFSKNFEAFHPVREPQIGVDPAYNPFDNDGFPSEPLSFVNNYQTRGGYQQDNDFLPDSNSRSEDVAGTDSSGNHSGMGTSAFIDRRDDYGKLFEDKILPSRQILLFQGVYVIMPVISGLMFINVRKAYERILYEKFLGILSSGTHGTQVSLFPVTVNVGVGNMLLFTEHAEMLSSLGFDISPFGNDTIVVNGVPEGFSSEPGKVQAMVEDLLLALSDDSVSVSVNMYSAMAERFAKLGALNSDPLRSQTEAQALIDSLFSCGNPEFTPSGRKVAMIISKDDIDKKFN